MMEDRRKREMPDLTYDLDGDGFVGAKEYAVARLFDVEKKNSLSPDQRK